MLLVGPGLRGTPWAASSIKPVGAAEAAGYAAAALNGSPIRQTERLTQRREDQQCSTSSPTPPVPRSGAHTGGTPSLRELTAGVAERLRTAALGGDERSRLRHTGRGKMLVRDRVDRLIDPGSPLLEIAPLAGYEMY